MLPVLMFTIFLEIILLCEGIIGKIPNGIRIIHSCQFSHPSMHTGFLGWNFLGRSILLICLPDSSGDRKEKEQEIFLFV